MGDGEKRVREDEGWRAFVGSGWGDGACDRGVWVQKGSVVGRVGSMEGVLSDGSE